MEDEPVGTKVYKVTLLIIDHDDNGPDEIKSVIENQRYPNWCINPHVMGIEDRTVMWNDSNPLNLKSTQESEYKRLFGIE